MSWFLGVRACFFFWEREDRCVLGFFWERVRRGCVFWEEGWEKRVFFFSFLGGEGEREGEKGASVFFSGRGEGEKCVFSGGRGGGRVLGEGVFFFW